MRVDEAVQEQYSTNFGDFAEYSLARTVRRSRTAEIDTLGSWLNTT